MQFEKEKKPKKTVTWKLFGNFISETRPWTVFEILAIYCDKVNKVKCHWILHNSCKKPKIYVPEC